jgi:hypothetical protein
MCSERQMFAVIEARYNEIALTHNTHQLLSIKTDAPTDSVHNTFHYADMRGATAFLSSEILSFRLPKSA